MWHKIRTNGQLTAMPVGTLIIKYPVCGEPVDVFNMDDREMMSIRYVTSNAEKFEDIALSLISNNSERFAIADRIVFGPMHKQYRDIIKEGNYWTDEPMTF